MDISISVKDLKVDELIKILDSCNAESSFLIKSYGRDFTFGELKKQSESKVEDKNGSN